MNLKGTFSIPDFGFRISHGQGRRPPAGAQKNASRAIRNSKSARAFTLIEIMVALAIFSIVVAAIYSTWVLIVRASQTGRNTAAQAQRQRIALRTIEDSLTCLQSFQASMKYYVFTNLTQSGNQSELSFTARLPGFFPRNGKFVNPESGRDFSLRRLIFSVEPGPFSEKDLVLRQTPVLMDMDPDERQTPLVLARGVKKFTVECWATDTMEWVDEWVNTNSIPPMVRISLVLGGGTTPTLAVTRVIAIPSVTLPSGLQTGH
jgi:prepilin-type N-terminal cleavage/methylation domain-containing protein